VDFTNEMILKQAVDRITAGSRVLRREPRGQRVQNHVDGGRTWWAHFEFTRMNIEPIILTNEIEELRDVRRVRFELSGL